ncbi:formate dehydrogenase accessory sulfurtransferase FdhD [Corynebacterium sp. Marseille-P4321]|uniref:formate dehydrogenase accessory sulfurtransferase FdhD n=1 Tax=Corynebacterium sp. Marseille-P4321 TaxID=2736603 RepID=UPI00158DB467|nr:formate dehydrogenase accessory sulfurtransferase FdhD [Corynebacterium sp. Marseille-P4321]
MSRLKQSFAVTRIGADGTRDTRAGQVEVEEPLEIRARGEEVAQLFRTPGHDIELAHGVLLAHGLIKSAADVATARYCEGAIGGKNTYNLLDIDLARPAAPPQFIDPIPAQSCGISAEQRVRELAASLPVRPEFMPLDPEAVFAVPSQLSRHRKRALPTAAAGGVVRQDIGAVNAVHKLAGHMLLDASVPAADTILAVDSRVTFEMMRAAAAAGFGAVVTTADVTAMAVDLARETNTVLVGEASAERFSVYSGA